jgi:hypothetical protein
MEYEGGWIGKRNVDVQTWKETGYVRSSKE